MRFPVAAALVCTLSLTGCVYGVDDYDLPDENTAPSTATPPPPSSPRPVAPPELVLPSGCSLDDVRTNVGEPIRSEAFTLLAVRTLTVRLPEGGEAESGSPLDRLTVTYEDLGNGVRLEGNTRRLVAASAWVRLLRDQVRATGVVSSDFGNSIVVGYFQPDLDEEARYVLGYLGTEVRVPFVITACDGTRLADGDLVGVDPASSEGSVVVRCGAETTLDAELAAQLFEYCAN